jgi:NADH-quinone oxidoreductase subunit C
MSEHNLYETLQAKFGDQIAGANLEALDEWIEVTAAGLVDVCHFLKHDPDWQFNLLNCITVVDYFEPDPKKAAKAGWEPHLEVVYHLSSTEQKNADGSCFNVVLKVMTPRWKDDQEGQLPEVPSVASVWRTADWHERETYDLSGVMFTDHPDLRRILCPEDWEGHPLRKDYEMPLEYHGIRGR